MPSVPYSRLKRDEEGREGMTRFKDRIRVSDRFASLTRALPATRNKPRHRLRSIDLRGPLSLPHPDHAYPKFWTTTAFYPTDKLDLPPLARQIPTTHRLGHVS